MRFTSTAFLAFLASMAFETMITGISGSGDTPHQRQTKSSRPEVSPRSMMLFLKLTHVLSRSHLHYSVSVLIFIIFPSGDSLNDAMKLLF